MKWIFDRHPPPYQTVLLWAKVQEYIGFEYRLGHWNGVEWWVEPGRGKHEVMCWAKLTEPKEKQIPHTNAKHTTDQTPDLARQNQDEAE